LHAGVDENDRSLTRDFRNALRPCQSDIGWAGYRESCNRGRHRA